MKHRKVVDRTVVAQIDVSDGDGVVDRYTVTSANTVIRQDARGETVRELAFSNITEAFAFAIEQTGFASVVDELLDYSIYDEVREWARGDESGRSEPHADLQRWD